MPKRMKKGVNDFETWCHNNNMEYLLDEWDYSRNEDAMPSDFAYSSPRKIWWMCEKNIPL